MVTGNVSRPLMSDVAVVLPADDSAERWRQWQLRYSVTSRRDARRVRMIFIAIFAALGVWFGLQLLVPSLWP